MLQVKAINGILGRLYEDGDQYALDNRVPEVGSDATFEDGREFVFCSTDVNITSGQVVGAPAGSIELLAVSAAVPTASLEISTVLASVTADQYKGGYVTVTLGTGAGYTYKIKSNTASATVDAVDNTIILTLESEVLVALAATDNIILKPARTSKVLVGTASLDPVGVAVVATTAATSGKTQYFWAQTSGVAMIPGTAGAINVALSPALAGNVVAAAAGDIIVANGIAAGASNSMVNLCFPKA